MHNNFKKSAKETLTLSAEDLSAVKNGYNNVPIDSKYVDTN